MDFLFFFSNEPILERNYNWAKTQHQDVQSKDRRQSSHGDLVIISYIHNSTGPSPKLCAAESRAFLSLPAVRDNKFVC